MGLLAGRRYGEPTWKNPASHADGDPAFFTKASYEEDRLKTYRNEMAALVDFADLSDKRDIVTVIVGTSPEKTWAIHEHLLTSASVFANSTLARAGNEKEQRTLRLPNADATIFGTFVKFLYTSATGILTIDAGLKLYVLGAQLEAKEFCAKVRLSLDGVCFTFTEGQLEFVLENTAPGDPLRRSCLLRLCSNLRAPVITPYGEKFTKVLSEKYASEIVTLMMGNYAATEVDTNHTETQPPSAKRLKLDSVSGIANTEKTVRTHPTPKQIHSARARSSLARGSPPHLLHP